MATQEDTVVRELVCDLNETELLERGDAIAACELKAQELKVERRRLNAQLREQTDRLAELASVIDSKRETREVTCRWKPDWKQKVWLLTRSDTDEVVDQRAMSEADLQQRLSLDTGPERAAANGGSKRKRAPAAASSNGRKKQPSAAAAAR